MISLLIAQYRTILFISGFVCAALVSGCSSSGSGVAPSIMSSSTSSVVVISSSSNASISSTSSSVSSFSSTASGLAQGSDLYQEHDCALCHGALGGGGSSGVTLIPENWGLQALTERIRDTMPKASPSDCDQLCAEAIATHIVSWRVEKLCNGEEVLLPRRLRLLSPHEYQLTINELFGLEARNSFTSILPKTETVRGYDNNVPEIQVTYAHATQYWNLAETLSETVLLNRVADCDALALEACAEFMLGDFGQRIFRRPLSQDEIDIYTALFMTESTNEAAMRQVLKSMMMSPSFLYRSEVGEADGKGGFHLTSYEVATLLSYTFWGMLPDDELLSLASENSLIRPEVILAQTQRLLKDSKAENQLTYFAQQWLGVTEMVDIYRDPTVYSGFGWSMKQAMQQEFHLFFSDAFLNKTSTFKGLLMTDFVYANKILSEFYGLSGSDTSAFQKIAAGPERGGLLNLGGLLAVHARMNQTSPIARGVFVRERLMCQEFPPPPPAAGGIIPLNPRLSARERFSAHTDNDGCRSCHEKIDPIGFSFERYDGSGKYREVEGNNIAVDDSGSVTGLVRMFDTDYQAYSGTHGLANILAGSTHSAYCFADQFHTYLQGVKKPDNCTVENVVSRWSQKKYTLYDFWIEAVKSPSFIQRQ